MIIIQDYVGIWVIQGCIRIHGTYVAKGCPGLSIGIEVYIDGSGLH